MRKQTEQHEPAGIEQQQPAGAISIIGWDSPLRRDKLEKTGLQAGIRAPAHSGEKPPFFSQNRFRNRFFGVVYRYQPNEPTHASPSTTRYPEMRNDEQGRPNANSKLKTQI